LTEHAMEFDTLFSIAAFMFAAPFFFFVDFGLLSVFPLVLTYVVSVLAAKNPARTTHHPTFPNPLLIPLNPS